MSSHFKFFPDSSILITASYLRLKVTISLCFLQAATEHWAKRMGNKNINMKTGRGVSMSTVGVDIGDWTFEKKGGAGSAGSGGHGHGPVTFRTWDFGGQGGYSMA